MKPAEHRTTVSSCSKASVGRSLIVASVLCVVSKCPNICESFNISLPAAGCSKLTID